MFQVVEFPKVWMLHYRKLESGLDRMQERNLGIELVDFEPSNDHLLEKTARHPFIREENLQFLCIEKHAIQDLKTTCD